MNPLIPPIIIFIRHWDSYWIILHIIFTNLPLGDGAANSYPFFTLPVVLFARVAQLLPIDFHAIIDWRCSPSTSCSLLMFGPGPGAHRASMTIYGSALAEHSTPNHVTRSIRWRRCARRVHFLDSFPVPVLNAPESVISSAIDYIAIVWVLSSAVGVATR